MEWITCKKRNHAKILSKNTLEIIGWRETEKLPEIIKIQTDALANIDIKNLTIWDSGNGGSNGGAVSGHVKDLLSSLPPLTDIFAMVGAELPGFMQGTGAKEQAKVDATAKPAILLKS